MSERFCKNCDGIVYKTIVDVIGKTEFEGYYCNNCEIDVESDERESELNFD